LIPILYDKDETAFTSNGIGILSDTTFCNVTEERNGIYEITFSYPIEGALFEHIQEGCFVKAKANETSEAQIFHIYKSSKPINGIVTYYGEHISYELTGNPVEKVVITNATGAQGLNKVLEAAIVPHPYSGLSDIASRKSTTLSLLSVRAALGGVEGSLLDVYGGEYEFDNFTIKLHESRGSDTGIIIGYGKNLTDLQQEKNISETYTALFPYAKYTPEKEEGDEEDTEEVVVTLSEKIIYSSNATRPKVLTMDFTDKFSDDEEITEAALRQKAKAWAADSGYNKPSVSIKVAFTHLWQSPEYKQYAILERVSLCDTLTVNFEKLGVSAKAKVIKTVYDTLKEKYVSIELGDAKSNFADSINQTTQEIENIKTEVKKNETATAKKIAAAVANATALITGQNGGYVVLNPSNNPQEILIMDAPSINEAVKIWRWNSGGLGYSSNGYNGPFATAITQDGAIVADFITAGEINGALIKADTVSSSAISQTFKNEITKEISDNITEVTATITQLFEAADGRLKSEIEAHITETTQTLQTSIDQNAQKITLTATEIRDEVNSIKEGLETEIRQTADSITLTASELTMLSTEMYERTDSLREDLAAAEGEISTNAAAILDANTKIQQNANAITLTANDIRGELVEVEDGLQEQISANQADIEVNADNIKMRVAKSVEYSTATRDSAVPTYSNTTAAEKKKLYFCTSNESYYYYNEISASWVKVDSQCVYSAFIQTANGFEFSDLVKINGDLIVSGTISGDRISGGTITGATVASAPNQWGDGVKLNGSTQRLEILYNGAVVGAWGPTSLPGGSAIYPVGGATLTISGVAASGTWDFSDCEDVIGLPPTVAVFG